MAHEDWIPALVAAAGDPDMKAKLLKGQEPKAPRREIFSFDDNANLNAVRYDDWKISFKIMEGTIAEGKVFQPNMPVVIYLRQDPFERCSSESQMYFRRVADKLWTFVPAQVAVGQFLQSFKE